MTNRRVQRKKRGPRTERAYLNFGDGVAVTAWSYQNPKSRDVYACVTKGGHTVASFKIRVRP